ncbi:MAG: hypothetical protein LBG17_10225 [Bacteroidales bacterium]|jgi:hypothetical protein|nr:hypothetical protein [Bacteroidales bacterium]
MKETLAVKEKRIFQRGWMAVSQKNAAKVRGKLKAAMGVTTHQSFRDRMNGKVFLSEAEIKEIEAIFKKFGVTDIWGKA